ncbi:MAG TPA: acyl-CoA dehydrogenase [Intrasporangium sp.]|uniref:acyl-CoA dehydrogenase family protein n=1 Tax=Intrasporangium sp. TaxID=1925024 RepID=UPI002D794E53|nr:acyl-CoA dehydrogenase [Intrasporangium sp.]HET7399101.1 acyl-CoA dehydrogenase [Intrasporangium sp.]
MRWELAEEQELFQESLRGWLEKVAPSDRVRRWMDSSDPSAFEERLARDGWLAVGAAEERGGQGGGLLELALTAEELARRAAPSSAWLATMTALPALPDDVALDALGGGGFAALVVDGGRPVDCADGVSEDGQGRLHGSVPLVLGADRAARLVVPVRAPRGRELRLVDAADAGVTITRRSLLDRSRSAADVVLDGVSGRPLDVEAEVVLGEAALRGAVLVSADALGAMQRMLDLAVDYSLQRHQFGVPIGSFQAVKHAAASILVSVEAARSIVYYAAASVEAAQHDSATHAAIAKAQVTSSGVSVGDAALTMHGAIGYTWEHDLHLLYKRARLDERLWGRPSDWNERIATALELLPTG